MKLEFFLFAFQLLCGLAKYNSIQLRKIDPPQINNFPNNNSEIKEEEVYIFVPLIPYQLFENSIEIYNENAELLDSIDLKEFKEKIGMSEEEPAFIFNIKHVKDNIFVVPIIRLERYIEDDTPSVYYIFIDDYFNIRKELPDLQISSKIKSSVFESLRHVNKHDLTITEDFRYAIIIIKQYIEIDNLKTYFPNSVHKTALMRVDGLCAIDLKTSKEVSALPADGVFFEFDKWWKYVSNIENDHLYEEDTGITNSVVIMLINLMLLIDGSHFSSEYENTKLFLIHVNLFDTIYLLNWDFENRSSNSNEKSHEIIWALPSFSSPDVIKQEWYDKWEYVNDPFYGFSFAHDVNINNLPKGHILLLDNGRYHTASNTAGLSCPITRAIEYKIEMNKNGINRVTLMFSYPKISDYPEFIYLENAPETDLKKCGEFWKIHNYQPIFGSCRKTIEGNYVITHYPISLYLENEEEASSSPVKMIKVNSDGDVLNSWSPKNFRNLSFKIVPFNSKDFRDGLYSRNLVS